MRLKMAQFFFRPRCRHAQLDSVLSAQPPKQAFTSWSNAIRIYSSRLFIMFYID